jgi:CubicO group peptidase (beta-lactamase class C family)
LTGLPNWGGTPLELVRDPGARWGYSGEGFGFLQQAIEAKTGLDLNELMRREVFEPLGMSQSSYVWTEAYDDESATGHDLSGAVVPKRTPRQGHAAATLHATALDYARFLAAVLKGEGLSPALYEEMLEPQSQKWNDDAPVEHVYWGLGWGLQKTPRGTAIWHWGDNGVFRAFVIGYPAEDVGLVYFANSEKRLGGRRGAGLVLLRRHSLRDSRSRLRPLGRSRSAWRRSPCGGRSATRGPRRDSPSTAHSPSSIPTPWSDSRWAP